VVEVEAAQEVLVGLARAGVPGGDDARSVLDQVAGAQAQALAELGRTGHAH
jgi:hypothetical protein